MKPFLEKLASSKKVCDGSLYLFESYLSSEESGDALTILDSDEFPWDVAPKLYGQRLDQHAYQHNQRRSASTKKKIGRSPGLNLADVGPTTWGSSFRAKGVSSP